MFLRLCVFVAFVYLLGVKGDCDPYPAPEHGLIDCDCVNSSTCCVACQPGYYLQGPAEVVCQDDTWQGGEPVCTSCATLAAADYRSATVSYTRNNNVVLRFSCEDWTDLIGPKKLTCSSRTGEWSHNVAPICQPNFSRCGKKGNPACPKKSSKELAQAVAPYKELLTKKEKKLIQNLVEDMEQFAPRAGGFSRASCSKSLCQLNCIYLPRRWMNTCKKCKKRVSKCGKASGTVFGR